jgi:hypothetical protein
VPDYRLVEHIALDDAARATTNDHLAPARFDSGKPG